MSDSQKAIVEFADTILQHFPPYRWEDHQEKAWAETMVRELSGFSSAIVQRAAREIVRTRKKTQTPLVSECIEACIDAKRWIDADRHAHQLPVEGHAPSAGNLDWTAERLKLASELMDTPLGRQAAKEGWVGALWSFARRNSRLPQPQEVNQCKEAAKGFDEAYAVCIRGAAEGNPMMKSLEKLGAEMLRRRHVTEKRVLRERP